MTWSQGTGLFITLLDFQGGYCLPLLTSHYLFKYCVQCLPLHYQDLSTSWVLEMFELLPDHPVAAPNSTARKSYRIWRSNAAAISGVVLS